MTKYKRTGAHHRVLVVRVCICVVIYAMDVRSTLISPSPSPSPNGMDVKSIDKADEPVRHSIPCQPSRVPVRTVQLLFCSFFFFLF